MRTLRPTIERYGYLFAVICIAVATVLFYPGRDYFAKEQWALLYLLIIGLVAGLSGVRPALLAAVLAFLAWNYFFLPPFHTFRVTDPKDWLSLVVFLIVGVVMGLQTGRMRERESEALAREREMELLKEFSAHLVSETTVPDMVDILIREVMRATGASCVALLLPDSSGSLSAVQPTEKSCSIEPSILDIAKWVRKESKAVGLPVPSARSGIRSGGWPVSVDPENAGFGDRKDVFIPLMTASREEGVLYVGVRSDDIPYTLRNAQLMVAVANQAAAFLERKHLQTLAVQADALQEADKLKSTLISSVSHELKTPLASITATVSNLLEHDIEWDTATLHEELEAIQDDLQRLNGSIGSLLDLSRLESAAWEPKRDFYEFGEILGTAISRIPQKQRTRISFDIPDDLPLINVDFLQWARVLQNLLENALGYSSENSPVRVGATYTSADVKMWVEDEGPGIPLDDRERIFEKFYRGSTSTKVPSGTGLGLAVSREIVRFHGGKIWVEDIVPHGARMVISLPKEDQ